MMSANLNTLTPPENLYYPALDQTAARIAAKADLPRLIADKLVVPARAAQIRRERLHEHLAKTSEQFNATLVCGRAGSGKTALVADFAEASGRRVAWYTIESGDCDWRVFSSYLIGSLDRQPGNCEIFESADFINQDDAAEVWQTTEVLGGWLAETAAEKPLLVVLDDAHCVFDADWFADFFQTLLPHLGANVHLLMLARSLPPVPLWRMRSKQMLGVLDENLLAFSLDEAIRLFANHGLSASLARLAHQQTFGRAAKIKQTAETFSAAAANWVL